VEQTLKEIKLSFDPLDIYESMYLETARYKDLWGGRGRGGSRQATEYFLYLITQPHYFRGCFLRYIFNDIRDSLFRDFKDRIDEKGMNEADFRINESEMKIEYLPTGNTIISKGVVKTSGRTGKLKSIAGVTHILIEEADEIPEPDFDRLDESLRKIGVDIEIIRVFNPPPASHWIWRDYILTQVVDDPEVDPDEGTYFTAKPKKGSGVLSIWSWYKDNIENLNEKSILVLEKKKLRKATYHDYLTITKGYIGESAGGTIMKGCKPCTFDEYLELDYNEIHVLDFGETDTSPCALSSIKAHNINRWIKERWYQPMNEKMIGIGFCKLGFNNETPIVADSAEKEMIAKLRRGWTREELTADEIEMYPQLLKGFHVIAVIKGPGSIRLGLSMMASLNYYITECSINAWNEVRTYKRATDANGNFTNIPEDKNNHLIDGWRYRELAITSGQVA
jgi:phage terminase large subunit